jgi:hypothetical protein
MPFAKGKSGNPTGRPKGIQDKVSQEIRELARSVFTPAYWARVKRQAEAGELNPKVETTLLAYGFGQPTSSEDKQTGLTISLGFINAPAALGPAQTAIDVQVIDATPAQLPASTEPDETC